MELKVIPIMQVFIAVILMVTLAKLSPEFIPQPAYSWHFSRNLSIILFILATVIGVLAVYCFRKEKTTVNPTRPEKSSSIVDTGIYRFSRNPMYLALLLIIIALAVYLQNIASFFIIPLFIAYITRYQIIPEERMLTILFGEDYKDYCQKVRRWL